MRNKLESKGCIGTNCQALRRTEGKGSWYSPLSDTDTRKHNRTQKAAYILWISTIYSRGYIPRKALKPEASNVCYPTFAPQLEHFLTSSLQLSNKNGKKHSGKQNKRAKMNITQPLLFRPPFEITGGASALQYGHLNISASFFLFVF